MNFISVVLQVFVAGVNTRNQILQLCDVRQWRFPSFQQTLHLPCLGSVKVGFSWERFP